MPLTTGACIDVSEREAARMLDDAAIQPRYLTIQVLNKDYVRATQVTLDRVREA